MTASLSAYRIYRTIMKLNAVILAFFWGTILVCGLEPLSHPPSGFARTRISASETQPDAPAPTSLSTRRSVLTSVSSVATTVALSSLSSPKAHASSAIPTWPIEQGGSSVQMPVLALNTVGLSTEDSARAVKLALYYGISHVDFHPGKERDGVALFLQNNPNRRDNLFLNTKIRKPPPGTTPEDAAKRCQDQIEEDLATLKLKSVDMLMLRDSPDVQVMQAQWAVLEDALEKGQTRSIGVINYCQFSLDSILKTARITPCVNYFMQHVGMGLDPRGLRSYGESKGIRTFAYGAVGEPGPNSELLDNSTLKKIAKAHKVTPEAVALRWVLQSGAAASVRPTLEFALGKSVCPSSGECADGLARRAASFEWQLFPAEMKQLSSLTSPDDNPTLFSSTGCPGAFVMPKS